MAALLDELHLDRHASPVHVDLGHEISRRSEPPRLAAVWQIGADGRPACAWLMHAQARCRLPG